MSDDVRAWSAPGAPPPDGAAAPAAAAGHGIHLAHSLGALAASLALALLVGVAAALAGVEVDGATLVLVVLAAQWVPLVGWPLLAAAARPEGVRAALALHVRPVDLPLGLAAGIGSLLLSGVLVALTPWEISTPPAAEGLLGAEGIGAVAVVLAVAVGAPFVEELYFRGALAGSLQRMGASSVVVVVVTAVAFAVVHLEPTRLHVILATGLVLGVLRVTTGRIAAGVVAHATVNGTAAVGALLLG